MKDDRSVEIKADHLSGKRIDFIVAGGIAAIESPKLIRELRRYCADVRVIVTPNSEKFVTPLVFEWASGQPIVRELGGSAEHISNADACVVSPCTLDFLAKADLGIADNAALTLLQSLLERKPVFFQPSMHESLLQSPSFKTHRSRLAQMAHVHFIEPKYEEAKAKAADIESVAAEIVHRLQSDRPIANKKFLLLMGPTRSYLDDVRYLSNRSSGRMGLSIANELYLSGAHPIIVSGPVQVNFARHFEYHQVETREEMLEQGLQILETQEIAGTIYAAAVLDFEVDKPSAGKRSSKDESWAVQLKATEKIIDRLCNKTKFNVGFKLESGLSKDSFAARIRKWADKHQDCDLIIGNRLEEVSEGHHSGVVYSTKNQALKNFSTRDEAARAVVQAYEMSAA